MNSKQRWSHFVSGVPGDFHKDLEALNEKQLCSLHKLCIRNRISGGTTTIVGAAAVVPSCGASAIGIGIGSRRMAINTARIKMIEEILLKKGWKGHNTSWRDYALPVTMGVVGVGVGVGGLEGIGLSGIGLSSPDASLGLANGTVPPVDSLVSTTTSLSMVDTIPAAGVHDVEWIMTEDGLQPSVDGVLMDIDSSQPDLAALYDISLGAGTEDPSNYLAWGTDPSFGNPIAYNPSGIPIYDVPPTLPQDVTSTIYIDQYDAYTGVENTFSCAPSDVNDGYYAVEDPSPAAAQEPVPAPQQPLHNTYPPPTAQEGVLPPTEQHFYDSYLPTGYSSLSDVAYVTTTVAATQIATHTASAVASHTAQYGPQYIQDFLQQEARNAAQDAAISAITRIWEALVERQEPPKPGPGPGQIQLTPEFAIEFKKLLASPEWKALQKYLGQSNPYLMKSTQTTSHRGLEGLLPHHQDCLTMLCLFGYDKKLNEPQRLRFFIEQADGNVMYVQAWIDEYLCALPLKY